MLNNTNIIGAVSECMVMGYLVSQGYEVFLPHSGASRADLVYIKDGRSVKVQVKTACWTCAAESPHKYEQCVVKKTRSGTYEEMEIDEFWIVGTHLWCFPFESVGKVVNLSLGTTNPKPRKTVRTYDPNDFVVVWGSLEEPFRDRLFKDATAPFVSVTNDSYNPETVRTMRYKPGGDRHHAKGNDNDDHHD